jgi:hypothetical protein
MTETKPDRFLMWIALSTATMAVLAALTTLYLGKYTSRTILMQGQETDQWAYYQAKSIKSHTYELQKKNLELELMNEAGRMREAVAEQYRKVVADYDKTIKRYDQEKNEIKAEAERLAAEKNVAQNRAANFGYGLIFLQIAIMLSSISAITKEKYLWYFGIVICAGWVFYFLNAWILFY